MAGTPTPNYQFPTYAETDTPNLAGAYNQAVNAIDAKIKEVADSIPSDVNVPDATSTTKGIAKLYDSATIGDSTQEDGGVTPAAMKSYVDEKVPEEQQGYTAGTGILIEGTKISARGAYAISSSNIDTVESTGLPADSPGTIMAACIEAGLVDRIAAVDDAEHNWPGGAVPTVQVLKYYVESKMAAAGAAYTGTAPIVVDNGSRNISVGYGTDIGYADGAYTEGVPGVVCAMNSTATLNYLTTGALPSAGGALMASIAGLRQWVLSRTPDASTSAKGLVQLTTSPASADSTMAVTGSGVVHLLSDRKTNATTNVTVDMLKHLYVDTSTGVVYYKPHTE